MVRPQLRVFRGPEDGDERTLAGGPAQAEVRAPLGELLPLLADAYNTRRAWLQDFQGESVTVSADLYDILTAYRQLRATG